MICFVWDGFPQYAARCVGACVRAFSDRVVVVATRPAVPVSGMEAAAGCRVVWIGYDEGRTLGEILGELPSTMIVSGWGIPVFNRFRDEVRAGGGRAIAMCDNNWSGFSWREALKAVRFRLLLRGKYSGFFVPGESARRLLGFYGVESDRIRLGAYAADASVFTAGGPLSRRERRLVYVGQFIERKNVLRLVEAFRRCGRRGWTLAFYGSGPLKSALEREADAARAEGVGVEVHDFVQPEQLASVYRGARGFVLPSASEHWGLVVHEAALSGCVLLVSDRVGAAVDLLGGEGAEGNGRRFDPDSTESLAAVLEWAMALEGGELDAIGIRSRAAAERFSLDRFVESVDFLVRLPCVPSR